MNVVREMRMQRWCVDHPIEFKILILPGSLRSVLYAVSEMELTRMLHEKEKQKKKRWKEREKNKIKHWK